MSDDERVENGIYLAGPVEQDDDPRSWRDEIKLRFPHVDFVDPMDFQGDWEEDPVGVIERELEVCETHPILVCNIGSEAPETIGTHHEISHALAHGNDRIAVVPDGEVAGFIEHRVTTFDSAEMAVSALVDGPAAGEEKELVTDGGTDAEGVVQIDLTGEEVEDDYRPPDTFVVCAETGRFLLRSERHDWPHETISMEEWFESDDSDLVGDYAPEDKVGAWFDITLSYSVDYRFRVPAYTKHQAKEIAEDWALDAQAADKMLVHTETRESKDIYRDDLPNDWDPYGGERISEVIYDDE